MTAWLLKSIGVSDAVTQKLDHVELGWHRPHYLWVGLILAILVGYFIAQRHRRNLPHVAPAARGVLTACRIGVMVLLVVVLAGPYLQLKEDVSQKPILAVLIDESASMNLPVGPYDGAAVDQIAAAAGLREPVPPADSAPPPADAASADAAQQQAAIRKQLNTMSRTALLDRVLEHHKSILDDLHKRFDVRAVRVSRKVRVSQWGQPPAEPVASSTADETALGDALEQVFEQAAGTRIEGVVIFSDGRTTTGSDPLQVLRRYLNAHNAGQQTAPTPVFAIPVGSAQPPLDVGILDVLAPDRITQGDTATVVATIGATGFDGRSVTITLTDGEQTIDQKPLTLRDNQRQQVQLNFPASGSGPRLLQVKVEELAEEQVHQNNMQTLAIEVAGERHRVLYLEHSPRWDFRFLDHALRRDAGLDVQMVMQSQLEGNGVKPEDLPTAAGLPEDAAGWAEYHAVLLGDISPDLLPPRMQEQLARAVREEGVGLVIQAGPQFMPQAFVDQPLGALLPLKFDSMPPLQPGQLSGLQAAAFAPFKMQVTAEGSTHPAFQLYDVATKNRQIWSQMPGYYWTMQPSEPKPAAQVLAHTQAPGERWPLIAEHLVGRGRVMIIGTDSTYRWRRNIGSHLFYRFWGQSIRHVVRNEQRNSDRTWLEVSPRRVEPGQPVSIQLYTIEEDGQPSLRPNQSITIQAGLSTQAQVLESSNQPGLFHGQWVPDQPGNYRLSFRDANQRTVGVAVRVAGSGQELLRIHVDRDALGSLADASGGRLLELNEMEQLPKLLKGESVSISRTHEEDIWDNWLTLILLVGLYCTDVGVRRLMGLT